MLPLYKTIPLKICAAEIACPFYSRSGSFGNDLHANIIEYGANSHSAGDAFLPRMLRVASDETHVRFGCEAGICSARAHVRCGPAPDLSAIP